MRNPEDEYWNMQEDRGIPEHLLYPVDISLNSYMLCQLLVAGQVIGTDITPDGREWLDREIGEDHWCYEDLFQELEEEEDGHNHLFNLGLGNCKIVGVRFHFATADQAMIFRLTWA